MGEAEALHLLLLHGPGTTGPAGEPLVLEDGFLGCLRPYIGLREPNFHQVMQAVLTVGGRFRDTQQVDREAVRAVWSICSTARAWGLDAGGMLQRNRLITPADSARLTRWVGLIETTTLRLLSGWPPHRAAVGYAEYVAGAGGPHDAAWLVPLLAQAVSDPAVGDGVEYVAGALARLGQVAEPALPALRSAERRSYTWYAPEDRCTDEVRACIRRAVQAIEGAADAEPGAAADGGGT